MTTQRDVRRIALSLDGVEENPDRFAFSVKVGSKDKGIAWVWLDRPDPKKARVPNPKVLAVTVASLEDRQVLIDGAPEKFFTEPHYRNYPAVLVRLAEVNAAELRALLEEAWRVQTTPKRRARSTASRSGRRGRSAGSAAGTAGR